MIDLTLSAVDLSVEVSDAASRRVRQFEQRSHIEDIPTEVVMQWTIVMVVSDEKKLCPWSGSLDVGRNEPWLN